MSQFKTPEDFAEFLDNVQWLGKVRDAQTACRALSKLDPMTDILGTVRALMVAQVAINAAMERPLHDLLNNIKSKPTGGNDGENQH